MIALDFNEHALATFKHNMPDTEIVHGDITDSAIKKEDNQNEPREKNQHDYWRSALSGFFS